MRRSIWSITLVSTLAVMGCSQDSIDKREETDGTPGSQTAFATPEEVVEAFVEAIGDSDLEKVKGLVTERSRVFFDSAEAAGGAPPFLGVGEVAIEDDLAEVTVEIGEAGAPGTGKVLARREDGEWRVYGMKQELAPEMEMTVNFEEFASQMDEMLGGMAESMESSFEEMFGEEDDEATSASQAAERKAAFGRIQAVSRAAFEASWSTDLEVRDKPAIQVLNELAKRLELAVEPGAHGPALTTAISLNLKNVSCLQAVEEVCRSVGTYPVYPDVSLGNFPMGGMLSAMAEGFVEGMEASELLAMHDTPAEAEEGLTLTFRKGPRPYPAAFAGPFIIEAYQLEENVPHATGSLGLSVKAFGLPPGLPERLAEQDPVECNDLLDGEGRRLNKDQGVVASWMREAYEGAYKFDATAELMNLVRSLTALPALTGTLTVNLPVQVAEVHFATVEEGQQTQAGELSVTISDIGFSVEYEVRGPSHALNNLESVCLPFDRDGTVLSSPPFPRRLWVEDFGASSNVARGELDLEDEPPDALTMKIIQTETLEYGFTLDPIPLRRYSEMPEAIDEINFGGHAVPLSLTFLRFEESKFGPNMPPDMVLQVTNHANKDVTLVLGKGTFLDESGKEVPNPRWNPSFPTNPISNDRVCTERIMLTPPLAAGTKGCVVRKGSTSEARESVFEPPEAAKGARFDVKRVEFSDGSTWETEQVPPTTPQMPGTGMSGARARPGQTSTTALPSVGAIAPEVTTQPFPDMARQADRAPAQSGEIGGEGSVTPKGVVAGSMESLTPVSHTDAAAISPPRASAADEGDSITHDGVTYRNVYIRESPGRYYVQFPEDGRTESFAKEEVTAVSIHPDDSVRRRALTKWKANRPKFPGMYRGRSRDKRAEPSQTELPSAGYPSSLPARELAAPPPPSSVYTRDTGAGIPTALAGAGIGLILVFFLGPLLYVVSTWRLFTKADRPGWAVLVPIYNLVVMAEVCGRPGWWAVLMLIPCINAIVGLVLAFDLVRQFGQPAWHGLLFLLLWPVYLPYLAFSNSVQYEG